MAAVALIFMQPRDAGRYLQLICELFLSKLVAGETVAVRCLDLRIQLGRTEPPLAVMVEERPTTQFQPSFPHPQTPSTASIIA